MSKIITQSLEGNILHAFGLCNEFIKVCPDAVWGKKVGGWPVWQQLYHAFGAIDFFLRGPNDPEEQSLIGPGVADLKESPAQAPSKETIGEYVRKKEAQVKEYIGKLDDASLSGKNEGISSRFGRDVTHAATLALIGSHTMYHLGGCDAALRENGLPGVF